jgi:hypothetical protein
MIADNYPSLHFPVRVYADGEVEAGPHLVILHRKRDGQRIVAAPPMRAHTTRFTGLSDIPAGVDQTITIPHDCANHGGGE